VEYQSYKIIKKSELDYIKKGVNSALIKWRSMWCLDNSFDINLDVQAVQDYGDLLVDCESSWVVGDLDGDQLIGMHWSSSFPDAMYDSFINVSSAYRTHSGAESLISKKLLNRSLTALLEMIVDEFTSQTPVITASKKDDKDYIADMSRPGGGHVLLLINFDESSYLVISINTNSIIQTEITDNKAINLTEAINAFGDSKVELKVSLGSAELDVESVTGLSVGDVITVDKLLNEKLSVFVGGKEVCDGYIGKQDNNLSIKIDNSGLNQ